VTGNINASGSAKDIVVKGNLNQLFVARGATNLTVLGNAGLIDGGLSINNATIGGSVDILKATSNVANVRVNGNAGILSSGNTMSNVFVTGSSISVGAGIMKNVQVSGSVGASISTGVFAGTTYGEVGLGSAFSLSQIAYLVLGNSSASLAELSAIGNTGALNGEVIIIPGTNTGNGPGDNNNTVAYPAETLYYGGLQARTAHNVVVGGGISDAIVQASTGSDSLFNDVQDDAIIHVGPRIFTKVNGVITSPISTSAH
jgi:hypothetical protein